MLEKDWLTGLYTAEAIEKKVETFLKNGSAGTLILTDIRGFEEINKTYGHLNGDKLIQEFAATLEEIREPLDVMGRIGPDVFALFFCGERDFDRVDHIKNQIREGIKKAALETDIKEEVETVTVAATGEANEESSKIFARAFLVLTCEKRSRDKETVCGSTVKPSVSQESAVRDIEIISADLGEKDNIRGAYLQNYESFKRIYRFVARGLERTKDSAYIMLLTLDGKAGSDALLPDEMEELMELLYQVIKNELRRGDAFTQYSSSQYLLMVLSTSHENAVKIGERVKKSFEQVVLYEYELSLCSDVCALRMPKR